MLKGVVSKNQGCPFPVPPVPLSPPSSSLFPLRHIATTPMINKSLHGLAPQYFVDDLRYVTDIPDDETTTTAISKLFPRTRLVTVGDRTFSAAAGIEVVEQFTARCH